MKKLVLVGGGHAQLSVLQTLATSRVRGVEATLITPSAHQNYSGMLPGWMAGHYTQEQCRIDLRPVVGFDPGIAGGLPIGLIPDVFGSGGESISWG